MCTACWCGTTWPRALMGTVDRGPIIAAGSQCPDDSGWLPSIAGLTDIAITRVYPRKPSGAAELSRLGRRRLAAEVLLARHQRPTDARQLVGQGDRDHLARFAASVSEEFPHLLGHDVSEDHADVRDAGVPQVLEAVEDVRLVRERDELLGSRVRQGPEPGAVAAGQDESFHAGLTT